MLYRNYNEILRISRATDCVAYLQTPHFTNDPMPSYLDYSEVEPARTQEYLENQKRIENIINKFKERQNENL